MTIQLTEKQGEELRRSEQSPVCVIDPLTNALWYLVSASETIRLRWKYWKRNGSKRLFMRSGFAMRRRDWSRTNDPPRRDLYCGFPGSGAASGHCCFSRKSEPGLLRAGRCLYFCAVRVPQRSAQLCPFQRGKIRIYAGLRGSRRKYAGYRNKSTGYAKWAAGHT